jgi:hypothetical protein
MRAASLVGYAAFFFTVMPAWAVKAASTGNRVLMWAFPVGLLFSFVAVIKMAAPKQVAEASPFVRRYRPYLAACVGGSFLIAELAAIAFTYARPGVGLIGQLGQISGRIGAAVFPVVAKYATAVQPPLSLENLFRIQAIVSPFLFAGLTSFAAMIAYVIALPAVERSELWQTSGRPKPTTVVALFVVPFGLWAGADAFFGLTDFGTRVVSQESKACLFSALCYANGDDMLVFFVAVMKSLQMFGFPLGAIGYLYKALARS